MRFSNHWINKRVKAPPSSKHWKKKFQTLETALLLLELIGNDLNLNGVAIPSGASLLFEVEVVKCAN